MLAVVLGGGVAVWAIAFRGADKPTVTPTAGPTSLPSATSANPGLKPWAQATLYSPEERALATAAPSMVFVEVIFTGYLRNKKDNVLLRPAPVTFNRRCSGFVVNSDGHVLTNGQCVRPTQDIVLSGALSALGNILVREGTLNGKDLASFTAARMKTTLFTGFEPTAEPEAKLYGQLNVAKGDITDSPAIPATVVQAQVLDEGNLALVKLAQGDLPVAELNPAAAIGPETPLLVIGYQTSDTSFRSATYSLMSKAVTVTEVDSQSPVRPYRISEDIGVYSRGGIAIDASGRVVGMLDNDMLRPDRANRLVAPVSAMTGLLSAAGVQNSLGEADRQYRSGLEAYFARDNSTAISHFDKVLEKSPANVLAQLYRQAAVDSRGESESSGWPGWVLPVLIAVGVVIVAGVVLMVVLVRRSRNRLV
ncbi:S1 family peptidase [Micromonospora sp. NPDC003197]